MSLSKRLRRAASAALVVTLLTSGAHAGAQSDSASLAELGLPELKLTLDTAFAGLPPEIEAGRYAIRFDNGRTDRSWCASFLGAPGGMDATALASSLEQAAAAGRTGGEAGPPVVPEIFFEASAAGGACAPAGSAALAIVDLHPGEWVLWSDDLTAPIAPVPFVVTGAMPSDLPEPDASVTLDMRDFSFTWSAPATAGTLLVQITNSGEQPHFAAIFKTAEIMDMESFMAMISMSDPATPGAQAQMVDYARSAFQSAETTSWIELTMEPGFYLMTCIVPDPTSGTPHAFMGMTDFFEVV